MQYDNPKEDYETRLESMSTSDNHGYEPPHSGQNMLNDTNKRLPDTPRLCNPANVDPHITASNSSSPTQSSKPTDDAPQWNANYTSPVNPSANRRPSSPAEAAAGARSPEELLRRLSLTRQSPEHQSAVDFNPRTAYPGLELSGNIISATFCVPYKINYGSDGDWELIARRGTSALFDSFSYLASPEIPWKHTLVGWTGEIDRIPNRATDTWMFDGTMNSAPLNKASAPIPVDPHAKIPQPNESADLRIPVEDQKRLKLELERDHGGRVAPVWLVDEADSDDAVTLRDQHKWRRYGEHELFTLFHYKQNEPSDGRAMKKAWKDYVKMNEAFADAIVAVYRPGDVILVHDYQLLLLPSFLRQRIPTIYVGFFLHIPFPSSEYYRCLTKRNDILQGVLGANMIGFQAFSYSRHFSSCCSRILSFDSSPAGVDFFGSHVAVDVFPIGINAATTLQSAFGTPAIEDKIAALRELYADKKIIVGRDRLDSVRGVAQKLQAFEIFLERHPEWHEKVVLIQVTSPTSIEDRDEKSDKTETKISDLVARINGNFGSLSFVPVHHYPQYLTKDEYFALLRIADLGLITSVRDGMNTTALEYILCQRDNHSPLIISEFSGTAGSLGDAMHINPWDLSGVADAIDKALKMSEADKNDSHQRLYKYVTKNTIQTWTDNYLKRLLTNLASFDTNKTTPPLDRAKLLDRYRNSSRRLFMFDYDGTLTPIVRDPDAAIPSDRVIRTLKTLAADTRNAVWIISGRDQKFLDEWMGHIPALGLSAEHGSFVRMPNSTHWENLTETFDMSWQTKVMRVFEKYTERTMGSFIERKKIALTWHYRRADPELGAYQARRCQVELEAKLTPHYDLEVMAGKANLEVRPRFVNKGEIAKRLVKAYGSGEASAPDFVLCLGDDFTDEDMFRSLRASKLRDDHVFAVTVGASSKQTLARWHLVEPPDVVSAIAMLNGTADAGNIGMPATLEASPPNNKA
ncbi:threalose-6-phosphate phosphatase [Vermiconidia calcicola]|uniref:Threalose-6-phosphate phosphatase n=1 Tax=Vermiconidia calcicola TaxID=1690605 RepID=A0ACC3NJN2_9PEZI|nr:threalose-6-phosphate phosphatase [Vermiconidia calcicola]